MTSRITQSLFTTVVSVKRHSVFRCNSSVLNDLRESMKSELILDVPEQQKTLQNKNQKTLKHQKCYQKKKKSRNRQLYYQVVKYQILQVTHHQVIKSHILYGTTAGIQCFCISLMPVCWGFIKSISKWDSNDLDQILRKSDELFNSFNKLKLLGVEDLVTEMEIYSYYIDIALLENKTGENNFQYILDFNS